MATTFDISVIFKAIDQLSTPLTGMSKNLKSFSSGINKVGEMFKSTGENMMKYFTLPIAGAMALGVKDFADYQDALLRMNKAIEITGRTGQISADDLDELTKQLGDVTNYEHSASLEALALVQTMGNLNEKQLKELLPRLQDMSSGLQDMPLDVTAKLIAKVFSTGNVGLLKRYGIELKATGDKQKLLEELCVAVDGKFKGMSTTLRQGLNGSLKALKYNLMEIFENLGERLAPMIIKISDKFQIFRKWIDKLSPTTKKFLFELAVGLMVLGPIILGIGIALTTVGAMLAANPIGAIITGIALAIMLIIIVIRNWDAIWKVIMKTFNNIPTPLKVILAILLNILFPLAKLVLIPILIVRNWNKIVAVFKIIGSTFGRMPRIFQIFIGIMFSFITIPLLIIRNWKPISEFFGKLWTKISSDASKAFNSIKNFAGNIGGKIKAIWESSGLSDFFGKIWDGFLSGAEKVFNWLKDSLTDMFGEMMKNPIIKWLFETPQETKTSGAVNKLQNQVNKSEVTIKVVGDGSAQTTIQDVKDKGTTKTKDKNNNLGYSHP